MDRHGLFLKLPTFLVFSVALTLGASPSVPEDSLVAYLAFCVIHAIVFLYVIISNGIVIDKIFYITTTVYFLLILSSIFSYFSGAQLGHDILRGIFAPTFVFLLFAFKEISINDKKKIIELSCIVWMATVIAFALPHLSDLLSGYWARLTYIGWNSTIPFGLIGIIFYGDRLINGNANRRNAILFLMMVGIVLMLGYRSQIIMALAALLALAIGGGRLNFTQAIKITCAALIISASIYLTSSFGAVSDLPKRFSPESLFSGLAPRLEEVKFSLGVWGDNAILGAGFGQLVPVEITFYGAEQNFYDSLYVGQSRYLHNVFFYYLMCAGFCGGLVIVFIYFFAIKRLIFSIKHKDRNLIFPVCLNILLGIFLIQPAFKHAQNIVLFSLLFSVLPMVNKIGEKESQLK